VKLKVFLPALALALSPLLVVRPVIVSGPSMAPTFQDGELRLALRAWIASAPRRGEVWVVEGPAGSALKRVVGLPGERVELHGPHLRVDGRPIEEPWVRFAESQDQGPWSCGKGYLVMGDNRPASVDGRAWGALPPGAFLARVLTF
jgi:signal peptidase I